jgi:hypothetical protein
MGWERVKEGEQAFADPFVPTTASARRNPNSPRVCTSGALLITRLITRAEGQDVSEKPGRRVTRPSSSSIKGAASDRAN